MRISGWSRSAATALLLLAASPLAIAQTIASDADLTCLQSGSGNQSFSTKLANGAVVTVQSVSPNELKQTCEVVVRDRTGKPIFEDRGFNTRIDPATGRDIDNDGQPDAVVGIDTVGGTAGNWEYPVISFAPRPRLLLKLPPSRYDFQTKPGRTLVWTSTVFEGVNQSLSDVSTVARVHEFRTNGFIDVTQDYCKAMLTGEVQGNGNLRAPLATLNRQTKQESRMETGRPEDREDTRLAATTLALQQIYCGQIEEASRLVLEVWPAPEQSRVRRRIREAIEDRWPELAKQLSTWN